MDTVQSVARELEKKVGLRQTEALRITRKLNRLAASVPWAEALPDVQDRRKLGKAGGASLPASKANRARGASKKR